MLFKKLNESYYRNYLEKRLDLILKSFNKHDDFSVIVNKKCSTITGFFIEITDSRMKRLVSAYNNIPTISHELTCKEFCIFVLEYHKELNGLSNHNMCCSTLIALMDQHAKLLEGEICK